MTDEKTLYLMRHAEAAWMTPGQRDFDRPLDDRGERDAIKMGQRLKTRGVFPLAIIASPALRTVQTSELIATEIGFSVDKVSFCEAIYEARLSDLLEIIHSLDDSIYSVMIIGHNPSIGRLVSQLSGEHIANAPTGSIATLQTFSSRWEDTGFDTTDLLDFDYPEK